VKDADVVVVSEEAAVVTVVAIAVIVATVETVANAVVVAVAHQLKLPNDFDMSCHSRGCCNQIRDSDFYAGARL
jgi:hypothetical protein